MKTEMALRTHLRKGLCDASPEQRASIRNIRLPESAEEAKLHYKPGPSEEWCELVIYADLVVFHDAPAEGQVGKTIAKQHEAASTCYLAKARGGYEVPKKHRIHLDRCRLQDGPFDVLERFLRNLLELAEDHLRWCRDVNVAPTFKPGEEEAFHAAQNCQCCGAAFGLETMKVLHHRHGTGEYLAALCSPCNVAVRRRKLIPIFFHNRGGYDFHFLVRAIAHLKQEQPVEPESSDSEELSLDELEYLADLQLEDCEVCEQLVDWKELKFEVLVKSGERYLQVRLGPLLFLDSCNIFPTSLEALISDLRGTEENPAQAFPLLAERHPVFAAAELCEDRNRREQVWSKLLKKIPMPFEKLTGPECWDLPALMPDKSYYNSRLSGEICSDAKYKEIAEIVDFFGFKSFAEFHDVYLYTDMALADVVEAYREAFYENYSLDPVFYVTGASASWDAMLKKCVGKEQPLGLIQNREIFEITRASIRGGLCNPFQPHARANNPRLGELCNAEEATSYINKFDVNSQYPSVMSKPLPVDGGKAVKLADSKKGRLKQLNELLEVTDYASNEYATSHLVKVSYYVGFRAHDRVDWAPPARMSISTGELSEYSKQLMRQRGWEKSPGNPKLMPFLGMHKEEALQLRLLKFYMETMEVRVCEVHAIITFQCRAFMRPFIEECYARRLALKRACRKLQDKVVKTTMCVQFGKSVQNQEAFKNAQVFVDRRLYERKMGGSRVTDFHAYPSSAGFLGVIYSKRARGSLLKSVPQIGAFVLDEARLDIMKYHYSLRKIFDGGLGKPVDPAYSLADRSKVRAVYSDTDSDIVHIYSEEDPAVKLAHNNLVGDSPCFWDVGGDVKRTEEYLVGLGASPEAAKLAAKRRGELGGFGDEGAPLAIAEVVALAPKCYSEYLTDSTEFFHKFKVKGLSKQQRKKLTHEDYRKVWLSGRPGVVEPTYRFQSQNHVVGLVRIERIGVTPFTDKVHQLDAYNSRPHGHWRNLPEPIPSLCRLAFGLEGSRRLPECFVDLVLSYLLPGGGYLARELRSDGTVFSLDSLPCVVQKAWSCLSSLLPRRTESWKLQQRGLGQPAALRKPQPARSVVLMNRKERWSARSELLFCLKCGISCFFGNAGLCSRRCYWTRWEVCSAVCCSPSRAKFSALDWE